MPFEPEAPADYWYKMYQKILEENFKLKEEIKNYSRIDLIGQNGNTGDHYEENQDSRSN